MNSRTFSVLAVPIAVLGAALIGSGAARAGVQWTAAFSTDKPNIISLSGENQLVINPQPLATGTGNATVSAFELSVKSPFVGSSDSFTAQNYSLNLTLTDVASNLSKTLQFSGNLTGTITPSSAQLTNAFNAGQTEYAFDLGGDHYDVTIGPFTPQSGNGQAGRFDAMISASANESPPPTNPPPLSTPEPSTMVLVGMAAACLGGSMWRKRSAIR